jgi:hypothetical protein
MLIDTIIYGITLLDDMFVINFVSSIDHAVFGLSLLICPNAFWLLQEESLSSLTYPKGESSSSSSLEQAVSTDISMIAFMGAGTTLLSVFFYHVLFLRNERDERVLLRLKLVNYFCHVVLELRSILMPAIVVAVGQQQQRTVEANSFSGWHFNWWCDLVLFVTNNTSKWLLGRLVIDTVMMIWLARHCLMHMNGFRRSTLDSKSVQMAVLLEMAYYGSIGYILVASASSSSSASIQQSSSFQWKNDLVVALSWEGLHIFAMLLVLFWNADKVPRADAKILFIQNILFLLVLVRAIVHEDDDDASLPKTKIASAHDYETTRSWTLIHSGNQLFLMVHVLLTFVVFKLSGSDGAMLAEGMSMGSGESSSSSGAKALLPVPPFLVHEKEKAA